MAKTKIDWKLTVLFESIKEPLRLVALAIMAWIIGVIIPQIDEAWIPVVVVILRWVDKFLHEWGKEVDNDNIAGGLTRF